MTTHRLRSSPPSRSNGWHHTFARPRVIGGGRFAYQWNLAVAGALYEALGIAEVVLRNALDARLTVHHGTLAGHWYDDPIGLLSDVALDDIATARRRVARMHRPETPGRVLAELNFGFCKFLLARRYEATLWTPALRNAFPNLKPQRRATVYAALDDLQAVRNRIAHYEPIHSRDLGKDAVTIYRLLDWIDVDVRVWALGISRLQTALGQRPR